MCLKFLLVAGWGNDYLLAYVDLVILDGGIGVPDVGDAHTIAFRDFCQVVAGFHRVGAWLGDLSLFFLSLNNWFGFTGAGFSGLNNLLSGFCLGQCCWHAFTTGSFAIYHVIFLGHNEQSANFVTLSVGIEIA